jgi:ureidoacrylate peracid hydrolase
MEKNANNVLTEVFPDLPHFPILPRQTALLVVDMQKADAHPDFGMGIKAKAAGIADHFAYYWGAVAQAVSNQQLLLRAAREADVTVIYTRIATQTRNARDVGLQHRLVNLIVPADSVDAEILDEIRPQADDIVLSKTSSSPFNSTAIHQLLHNLGCDTLLVCGVVTNGCVEGTVRDASDLGYRVIMVPDSCAAVTPALHQAAITNLDNAFCNCRTTADVITELRALHNSNGAPAAAQAAAR